MVRKLRLFPEACGSSLLQVDEPLEQDSTFPYEALKPESSEE